MATICRGTVVACPALILPYVCYFQINPDPLRTDMPHVYVHVDRDIPPDQLAFRCKSYLYIGNFLKTTCMSTCTGQGFSSRSAGIQVQKLYITHIKKPRVCPRGQGHSSRSAGIQVQKLYMTCIKKTCMSTWTGTFHQISWHSGAKVTCT